LAVTTEQDRQDAVAGIPAVLAREFVALTAALSDATTVRGVLQRVTDVTRAVSYADLVSVTLRETDGQYRTPVETDPLATALDELQYRLDEGPCIEATRNPGPAVAFSADLGAGREFARFGPAAVELGVHCVLAVGLFPDGPSSRTGALNLYSRRPGGLSTVDRDITVVLAAHASTALMATRATTAAELEVAQLREALRSRDVIGQAKGILMERRGISADEAFEVLRAASQRLNVKLAQVAATLAEHRADL
jgi:hypothetical protein